MILPSFEDAWRERRRVNPRIIVLKINDKNQPKLTLGWLLVEREETYIRDSRDGTICEASICLSYKRILPKFTQKSTGKGYFSGGYSRSYNCVSLTSSSNSAGAVFLDLPDLYGQHIGTYLMNEIVLWVKQWPDAFVNSIKLDSAQAYESNKERRNRFYEQFGLIFEFNDEDRKAGKSHIIEAEKLRQVDTWRNNIAELRMLDYLAEIIKDDERLRNDLNIREQACTQLIAKINKAEKNPAKWAFKKLWRKNSHSIYKYLIISIIIVWCMQCFSYFYG